MARPTTKNPNAAVNIIAKAGATYTVAGVASSRNKKYQELTAPLVPDSPTPGAVLLDQNGCVYLPHVVGVMAGQDITIKNSDGLLHNINASPTEQRGFNTSQPVAMETTRSFGTVEVMVPLRCDVHGWMNAYVGVVDHPYHSVSNGSGAFDLSTLPPGDYVIEAWHERYGTQTQNVTVTTGETAEVTFTFRASMAQNAVVPLGTPIDFHAIAEAS